MSHTNHQLLLNRFDKVQQIREVLHRAGYTEENLMQRLQVNALPSHRQRRRKRPLLLQRTRHETELDVLIRLFFLLKPVSLSAAQHSVAPMNLHDWQEIGLLQLDDGQAAAQVELYPFQDAVVATDRPSLFGAKPDEVMSVSDASRHLAQMTIRRRSSHTLDLGAGCGIQALLASSHSERVTAVDCNPRAAMFGEFNSQLNDCQKITYSIGNLFEPVGSRTFDLIVSCPPFVISPDYQLIHTQNDLPADQFCRNIVQFAPSYLNKGGYCQVPGNWAQIAGQDWRSRLAELCQQTKCDALLTYSHTEDVATYALERLHTLEDDSCRVEIQFEKWLNYFEQQRIEAVGFGLVTLRRSKQATNWFHAEQIRPHQSGTTIERQFAIRDFLEQHRDDRALLKACLRRNENLRLQQRSKCTGSGWSAVDAQLNDKDDAAPTINVGPEVLAFLEQCEGIRSVLRCFQAAAPAKGKKTSPPPVFLKVVRRLVELGFLVAV